MIVKFLDCIQKSMEEAGHTFLVGYMYDTLILASTHLSEPLDESGNRNLETALSSLSRCRTDLFDI